MKCRPNAAPDKFGPNAAWSGGQFIGQRTFVEIVDFKKLEIERIALDTLQPYLTLVEAAAADNVSVAINSGFRSYPEQKFLHDGFTRRLPGFNKAAPPGTIEASKRHRLRHQGGRRRR